MVFCFLDGLGQVVAFALLDVTGGQDLGKTILASAGAGHGGPHGNPEEGVDGSMALEVSHGQGLHHFMAHHELDLEVGTWIHGNEKGNNMAILEEKAMYGLFVAKAIGGKDGIQTKTKIMWPRH